MKRLPYHQTLLIERKLHSDHITCLACLYGIAKLPTAIQPEMGTREIQVT